MGIVRFALRFPHTFYIVAGMMLFLGCSAVLVMPKDIFPAINIPVVTVIWQYSGLSPEEMEQRITTYSEFSISANVGNIRNIESQTFEGIAVEKIFFQPNVSIDLAISQIVSATDSIRVVLPTGIQPPIIVQYTASSVPVLQLSLSSDTLNEQQLYDYGLYQVRQAFAPIPGLTMPAPYGGKSRQIMADLDPDALRANGITPNDVVTAINVQNLTLPAGDAKLGDQQFIVRANTLASTLEALNRLPIKQSGLATVYLSDVAHVHDGWQVQGNIVDAEGSRSVLLTIIKNGDASTLNVVNKVKEALPAIQRAVHRPACRFTCCSISLCSFNRPSSACCARA
jgi:multidrug efflux pump subunit AcrB